MDTEL